MCIYIYIFFQEVEIAIPGSSYLIEAVLGPLVKPQETPKVDQGLLKKKLEREKAKQQEKSLKDTKIGRKLN